MALIVVADDEPDMGLIITRFLSAAGHTARWSGDGRAALAAIRTHPPDLVTTDALMPEMTGPDLVAAVRADPSSGTYRSPMISGSFDPAAPARSSGHAIPGTSHLMGVPACGG